MAVDFASFPKSLPVSDFLNFARGIRSASFTKRYHFARDKRKRLLKQIMGLLMGGYFSHRTGK